MKFFSEKDCDLTGRDGMRWKAISLDNANRLFEERGKVVYGHETGTCTKWYADNVVDASVGAKWKGLIFNIEPLEKDSAEKIAKDLADSLLAEPTQVHRDFKVFIDRAKKLLDQK